MHVENFIATNLFGNKVQWCVAMTYRRYAAFLDGRHCLIAWFSLDGPTDAFAVLGPYIRELTIKQYKETQNDY